MVNLFKKAFDFFIVLQFCVAFLAVSTNAFPTANERGAQIGRWFSWGQTADDLGQLVNENNARLTRVRVQDPNVPLAVSTNEHEAQIGRWFYWGQTADDLGQLVNENNARLTRVRVQDPSVPTFSATMVQNTGEFGSAWWWYYGVDAETVGSHLSQGNRLISIDPYFTAEGLRFVVVMVPNSGAQDRAWWWYFGQDAAQVGQLLQQNNARPVDLRPYNDNGQLKFVVVMIENVGADFKTWEWWFGESPEFINSRVQTGLRVLCVAPDPFGNFVAVLVEHEGEGWYWWYGISPNQALTNIGQHDTRLIDISPYTLNGNLVFTTVELDDNLGPQNGTEI